MARHGDVVQPDADARDGMSDLTDRERRMLAGFQHELATKDAELQQLRAQLARLEGVPPQRD